MFANWQIGYNDKVYDDTICRLNLHQGTAYGASSPRPAQLRGSAC